MTVSRQTEHNYRKSLERLRDSARGTPLVIDRLAEYGKSDWTFRDSSGGLIFSTSRYQVAAAFAIGFVTAWRQLQAEADRAIEREQARRAIPHGL